MNNTHINDQAAIYLLIIAYINIDCTTKQWKSFILIVRVDALYVLSILCYGSETSHGSFITFNIHIIKDMVIYVYAGGRWCMLVYTNWSYGRGMHFIKYRM